MREITISYPQNKTISFISGNDLITNKKNQQLWKTRDSTSKMPK